MVFVQIYSHIYKYIHYILNVVESEYGGGGQGCWATECTCSGVEMKKPRFCVLALGVMSRVVFGRHSGALMPVDNFRRGGEVVCE